VVLWVFMSDLRFQSDAAALLSFMLVVNAIAAMLIVPAWCVVFRPYFVVGGRSRGRLPVRCPPTLHWCSDRGSSEKL